jgi:hypothetical protein
MKGTVYTGRGDALPSWPSSLVFFLWLIFSRGFSGGGSFTWGVWMHRPIPMVPLCRQANFVVVVVQLPFFRIHYEVNAAFLDFGCFLDL